MTESEIRAMHRSERPGCGIAEELHVVPCGCGEAEMVQCATCESFTCESCGAAVVVQCEACGWSVALLNECACQAGRTAFVVAVVLAWIGIALGYALTGRGLMILAIYTIMGAAAVWFAVVEG